MVASRHHSALHRQIWRFIPRGELDKTGYTHPSENERKTINVARRDKQTRTTAQITHTRVLPFFPLSPSAHIRAEYRFNNVVDARRPSQCDAQGYSARATGEQLRSPFPCWRIAPSLWRFRTDQEEKNTVRPFLLYTHKSLVVLFSCRIVLSLKILWYRSWCSSRIGAMARMEFKPDSTWLRTVLGYFWPTIS